MAGAETSQIGRYGTISLLKQQDPPSVITAFGIDTEQLTFGRDRECGVRLYYPDVDPVHCKIVFEERKAFLVVLGQHGLLVDGCLVYPNTTTLGAPTTIPLTNNSEIEIRAKRFRFTYPPKELRTALAASPLRTNRAPRLSMINSAQVFSPRPSRNPAENLRVLQSPLRNNFLRSPLKPSRLFDGSSSRSSSPVKQPLSYAPQPSLMELEEEADDEDIVLVEGDQPQVVEDEKDLVILEDVEVSGDPASAFSSTFGAQHHSPFSLTLPQTPSLGRSISRNNLHRAVLIRSAQRAVLRAEKEKEDEMEEMEVLSAVASDEDFQSDDLHESDQQLDGNFSEENVDSDLILGVDDWNMQTVETEGAEPRGRPSSSWTSGRRLSVLGDNIDQNPPFDNDDTTPRHDERDQDDDGNLDNDGLMIPSTKTVTKNPFGAFMTPQPRSKRQPLEALSLARNLFKQVPQNEASIKSEGPVWPESRGTRFSVGGGEPRRMLVEMPWRVKDLVVPLKAEQHRHTTYLGEAEGHLQTSANTPRAARQTTPKQTGKTLNDQERKAIQERRRSALREADTFFIGGIPGMGVSPTKSSTSPVKPSRDPSVTLKRLQFSQENEEDARSTFLEGTIEMKDDDDDDNEVDTRSLLERMKVTVEEMKRRRSTMLVPQLAPDTEKEKLTRANSSLPASSGTDQGDEVRGESAREVVTQRIEGTREKPPSILRVGPKQRSSIVGRETKAGARETSSDSSEEIDDGAVEKSFSQLMGRESPEDIERSSDDIRDILEQDITIPFDHPTASFNEPVSLEISNGSTYPARIGTRNRGLTASAEPDPGLPTFRRGTSNKIAPTVSIASSEHREDLEENAASEPEAANRKLAGGQTIISETAIGIKEPELEDSRTVDLQGSDEGRQVLPIPVARAKRGRSFHTTASALSRRTRTIASTSRPRPIETISDNGEESLNSVERLAKATTARRTPTSKSKGRPRKVKEEEPEIPVAGKSSKITRSATVAGDGRKSFVTAKAPATRASGRRTLATAPSGASVADEQETRDKENSRRSKATPNEGSNVKITRNRKAVTEVPTTSKTAATTRIKDEENEDEAPRRSTRARARTKT